MSRPVRACRAAGVLPYSTLKSGQVLVLLGAEKGRPGPSGMRRTQWSDFGGNCEDFDLDVPATAAREFAEETLGLFAGASVDGEAVSQSAASMAACLRDAYLPNQSESSANTHLDNVYKCNLPIPSYGIKWVEAPIRWGTYAMFLVQVDYIDPFMFRMAMEDNSRTKAVAGAEKTSFAWVKGDHLVHAMRKAVDLWTQLTAEEAESAASSKKSCTPAVEMFESQGTTVLPGPEHNTKQRDDVLSACTPPPTGPSTSSPTCSAALASPKDDTPRPEEQTRRVAVNVMSFGDPKRARKLRLQPAFVATLARLLSLGLGSFLAGDTACIPTSPRLSPHNSRGGGALSSASPEAAPDRRGVKRRRSPNRLEEEDEERDVCKAGTPDPTNMLYWLRVVQDQNREQLNSPSASAMDNQSLGSGACDPRGVPLDVGFLQVFSAQCRVWVSGWFFVSARCVLADCPNPVLCLVQNTPGCARRCAQGVVVARDREDSWEARAVAAVLGALSDAADRVLTAGVAGESRAEAPVATHGTAATPSAHVSQAAAEVGESGSSQSSCVVTSRRTCTVGRDCCVATYWATQAAEWAAKRTAASRKVNAPGDCIDVRAEEEVNATHQPSNEEDADEWAAPRGQATTEAVLSERVARYDGADGALQGQAQGRASCVQQQGTESVQQAWAELARWLKHQDATTAEAGSEYVRSLLHWESLSRNQRKKLKKQNRHRMSAA